MKFWMFHLMPWPHLPDNFEDHYDTAWVTCSNGLFDPERGPQVYHQYNDQLAYADELGFDGVVINEHHQNAYGIMPSPNLIAAALSHRVQTARVMGLGNGLPIGVCLARGKAANLFRPGHHGSTFGGNPLACAAAHAVLDALEKDSLAERAGQLGERLLRGLGKALKGSNRIREIRGKGLMLAIELNAPQPGLAAAGLEAGILINVIGDRIVRLLPPLNLSDAQGDEIVAKVAALLLESNP